MTKPAELPSATAKRPAVPDRQQLHDERSSLRKLYGEQLSNPSPKSRKYLAGLFLAQGSASFSKRPVNGFVLLVASIDASIEAGDLPGAFQAVDILNEKCDVDGMATKAEAALALAGQKPTDAGALSDDVASLIELIDQLMDQGRLTTANRLCAAYASFASADASARAELQQHQKMVAELRSQADHFAGESRRLQAQPNDPQLNLSVGKSLCCRNDWTAGLPHLAKGSDATLQKLAARELAASDANARGEAANAWWDLPATAQTPVWRRAVVKHALDIYQSNLKEMTGLLHELAVKRTTEAHTVISRSTELLGRMSGPNSGISHGAVTLREQDAIGTAEKFSMPVTIRVVLQADGKGEVGIVFGRWLAFNRDVNPSELFLTNVRLDLAHNPPGSGLLPANKWVTIEVSVKPGRFDVTVDGQPRGGFDVEETSTPQPQPVEVCVRNGTVLVKSVQVTKGAP